VAIQSATALNAYLTTDPSGQFGAGSSAASTDGEVTPTKLEATPEAAPQAASEPVPAEDAPPSVATALPATYARNARPVLTRAEAPSVSFLA